MNDELEISLQGVHPVVLAYTFFIVRQNTLYIYKYILYNSLIVITMVPKHNMTTF
jgi:hypothetical protein